MKSPLSEFMNDLVRLNNGPLHIQDDNPRLPQSAYAGTAQRVTAGQQPTVSTTPYSRNGQSHGVCRWSSSSPTTAHSVPAPIALSPNIMLVRDSRGNVVLSPPTHGTPPAGPAGLVATPDMPRRCTCRWGESSVSPPPPPLNSDTRWDHDASPMVIVSPSSTVTPAAAAAIRNHTQSPVMPSRKSFSNAKLVAKDAATSTAHSPLGSTAGPRKHRSVLPPLTRRTASSALRELPY